MRYDPDNIDEYELAMQDKADRIYLAKVAAHPDCCDPEHPGCEQCEEQETE